MNQVAQSPSPLRGPWLQLTLCPWLSFHVLFNSARFAAVVMRSYVRVVLCVVILSTQVSAEHHPLGATVKIGDVMIGGLFGLRTADSEEQCGAFYPMGLGFAEAMSFAVEKVNKDRSLLRGVRLGYDIRDYCQSALYAMRYSYEFVKRTDPDCVANYTTLTQTLPVGFTAAHSRPLVALIGPIDSASTIVVASLLKVSDIPIVAPTATSDELSLRLYRHVFRTIPPDKWQASVMADLIDQFNWTFVATIAVDDPYGRNAVWALERESYTRRTFCIGMEEFIPRIRYQSKLEVVLHKLKRNANIRVVILWLFGSHAPEFFKKAKELQLFNRTWILSEAIAANEGFLSAKYVDLLDGSLGIQPRLHRDQDLENHYERLGFEESYSQGGSWWKELWKVEFNCTDYDACQGRNIRLTAEIIRKFYNPYTAYVVDAVYAIAHALDEIYRFGSSNVSTPPFNKQDFSNFLRNVHFHGVSGKIQFDEFGDPLRASYDVVNFRRGSPHANYNVKELVGLWNRTATPRLALNSSAIQWSPRTGRSKVPISVCAEPCPPGSRKTFLSPCCWECVECPPGMVTSSSNSLNCTVCKEKQRANDQRTTCEDLPFHNLQWHSIAGSVVIVTTTCGLLGTLLSLAVFVKYRNSPIVKASNKELSFLLLGTVANFSLIVLLSLLTPNPLLCRVTQCLRYVTYTLCVTILLLKTMRILSAFRVNVVTERFKQRILKVQSQSLLAAPFLAVQSMFIVCWFWLDPPRYMEAVSPGRYIQASCRPYSSEKGQALVLTNCCYILFLSLLCTYYSFKARNIPDNFNEAKYVGFSMYILLLSAAAYYPAEFALPGYYGNVVVCISLTVTSWGLLGCLFAPKIYVILRHPEKNTESFLSGQITRFAFGQMHSVSRSRVASYAPNPPVVSTRPTSDSATRQ